MPFTSKYQQRATIVAILLNTWSTCRRWKFAYPDPLANFHKPVAQGGSRNDIYGVMRRPSNVTATPELPGFTWIHLEQLETCKIFTCNSCQHSTTPGGPVYVGNSPTLIPWPIFNTIVAQGGSRNDIYGVMRRPSNVTATPELPGFTWSSLETCKTHTWIPCQHSTTPGGPVYVGNSPTLIPWPIFNSWPKGDLGTTLME
ncbi:uncharacterized protein [Drosophila bipectinata]|uniref:uncharacterized protein n=1 Tax=Drosophila bipectinata TaxID=42026 RepID=UPI0038B27079